MSTTDTPSWAAAAATERPPEPAPITHRSTRSSPLAVRRPSVLLPAVRLPVRPCRRRQPIRIKPAAAIIWLLHACSSIS